MTLQYFNRFPIHLIPEILFKIRNEREDLDNLGAQCAVWYASCFMGNI